MTTACQSGEAVAKSKLEGQRVKKDKSKQQHDVNRRDFIGGSDARIVMGADEKALHNLWLEKRGECPPTDLSNELIVQLGLVTEDLNRRWYERHSGNQVTEVQ